MHPAYRGAYYGDWKRRVRQRAEPLVASWNQAMALAEAELRAEGKRFSLIQEVEERARAILAREEAR